MFQKPVRLVNVSNNFKQYIFLLFKRFELQYHTFKLDIFNRKLPLVHY